MFNYFYNWQDLKSEYFVNKTEICYVWYLVMYCNSKISQIQKNSIIDLFNLISKCTGVFKYNIIVHL